MHMDTRDMARGPNQILPRKGMHTYKPYLTQKRCRYPQGSDTKARQLCFDTKNMGTYQTKLNKEGREP